MKEAIEPLSEYSMDAAREGIEEYRGSRDYPAKAGAMSALAIILYDEAVRARARLAQLESVLAEAREALGPLGDAGRVKLCGEWRDDQSIQKTDTAFFVTFGDLRRAATVSAKIDAMDTALKEDGR